MPSTVGMLDLLVLNDCVVHIIFKASNSVPLAFNNRLLQELLMEVDLMNLKLSMVKQL